MGIDVATSKKTLHFKVSSALKTLIGRDLITDEFVAIFELVKNSFDAHASRVDILFEKDRVYIVDNGKGMALPDLIDKWLFVAYSAKGDGTEDHDYRENINSTKAYAGSKGVGRFSCDRLGRFLLLRTKTKSALKYEALDIDWYAFEKNSKEEMTTIPVTHTSEDHASLPPP
jgi:HSP90 family molecular chaperone